MVRPHMLATLLVPALLAALPAAHTEDPVEIGDLAWGEGDRGQAHAAWRRAEQDADPAVRAMGATRLLLVSGNLGLGVHGPRADQAIASCPVRRPRCALARADYELLLHAIGLPWDRDEAITQARRARRAMPGAAQARLVWAGAAEWRSLQEVERDGLGQVLLDHQGRWPSGPGTWMLGVGASAAPGIGTGGLLHLVHPDVAWRGWRLDATASASSVGYGGLSVGLSTPHTITQGLATRSLVLRDDGGHAYDSATLRVAPLTLHGPWSAWLGPELRWLREDTPLLAPGLWAGITWRGPVRLSLSATQASRIWGSDYDHLGASLDARWTHPLGAGAVAARAVVAGVPWGDGPDLRWPAAGGGEILRSSQYARWRDRDLEAAVIEWRPALSPMVGGALFVEGARVDGWHGGVGGGLRLHLPPRPLNTVRLDLAWGDTGPALTAGWGEAF